MLLQTGREPLEPVMKRIGTRHAVWHNSKYEAGHLFQERCKSEAVKDGVYFVTVLRCILNDPVKAGICGKATDYMLGSARDCLRDNGMTDTAFAEEMPGRDVLLEYPRAPCEDICMNDTPAGMGDRAAVQVLCRITDTADVEKSRRIASERPNRFIPALRAAGLSIRQINRLTGVSFGT